MNLKQFLSKWKLLIGFIIILLIVCGVSKLKKNEGTVIAPKEVSFVKQAHGSGTHVWFMSTGKAKDSSVYYIIILRNGKAETYRTYDDNTTLGKISKMNNSEIINYAKEQDKKYFNASVKETTLGKRNKHAGFNADFKSPIWMPEYFVLKKDDKLIGIAINAYKNSQLPAYVIFNADGKVTSDKNGTTQIPKGATITSVRLPTSTNKSENNMVLRDRLYDSLITHIKETDYVPPKPVKVKATSKTDDSGNNIVKQKVTIQYTESLKTTWIERNFLAIAKNNPPMMKQLYHLEQTKVEAAAESRTSSDSKKTDDARKMYLDGVNKMFTKKVCYDLMNNVFGNYQEEYTLHLEEPTEFSIYDNRFIGYFRGSSNGYLVTKAQNDKQTAVFAK